MIASKQSLWKKNDSNLTTKYVYVFFAGNLLKLLEVSSLENVLPTTYGKLQPPLGKHRLKVYLI